jgi:hypothetical protein
MPSSPQNQGEDSGLHQANSATVNNKKERKGSCSETSGIIPEKMGKKKKKLSIRKSRNKSELPGKQN